MAKMILDYKIMPKDAETNLNEVKETIKKVIEELEGNLLSIEEVPFSFGLKTINISLNLDEKKGTEVLEKLLKEIKGVKSVEITSMSRALG